MQCQSYFPVFYSRNDLNVDANGSTSSVYTGHIPSATGHYNHGLLASSTAKGLIGHDKEFLRQTIIKHEATFKDQVHELHRLYRRQKELLDEIKKNESYKKHLHANSQWSSPSTQSVPSQRTKHNPSLESFVYSRPLISGMENAYSPKKSNGKGSISEGLHPSQNINSLNTLDFSLSGSKRTRRTVLDLHLPAEEYINIEDEEPLRDAKVSHISNMASPTLRQMSNVAPMGNARPSFASGQLDAFYQVGSTSQAKISSRSIHFAMFNGANLSSNSGSQRIFNSSGSQPIFNGTLDDYRNRKKQKFCAVVSEAAEIKTTNRWQTANGNGKNETSLNSSNWGSHPQSLWRFHSETELARAHNHPNPLYFHKKDGSLRIERTNLEPRFFESISCCFNNNSGSVGASRPTLQHPAFSQSEMHLLLASRKRDHTLNDVAVIQAFPNFPRSTSAKISSKGHKSVVAAQLDDSSGPTSVCDEGKSLKASYFESITKGSSGSGFPYDHYLASTMNQCMENQTSILRGIDLNSVAVVDMAIFSSPSNVASQEVESQAFPVSGISQDLSSCNEDVKLKGNGGGSGSEPNQMILSEGFHLLSSTDTLSDEQNGKTSKSKSFDINLPCDDMINVKGLGEDPVISLKLHVNAGGTSQGPLSSNGNILEVDLEEPISPEKLEHPQPRGESEENDKTETKLFVSSQKDCGQSFLEELETTAAKALVSISTYEDQTQLSASEQFKASLVDSLSWFAEVVCSKDREDGSNSEEFSSSNGIDYFEAMTLKLTETGVEDYPSWATMVQNENEPCAIPPSSGGRPMRCSRTMKRAKRKEFQREVLLSLASLSRYEVSEDIQMIEGLMEANGTPWKTSAKMRKMGQNGNGRPRKWKQPCYSIPDFEENVECLFSKMSVNNTAVTLKDERAVNWEKAKRRRRGRRCRISLPCSTLSQDGWMRKWGMIGLAPRGKMKRKRGMII